MQPMPAAVDEMKLPGCLANHMKSVSVSRKGSIHSIHATEMVMEEGSNTELPSPAIISRPPLTTHG